MRVVRIIVAVALLASGVFAASQVSTKESADTGTPQYDPGGGGRI